MGPACAIFASDSLVGGMELELGYLINKTINLQQMKANTESEVVANVVDISLRRHLVRAS